MHAALFRATFLAVLCAHPSYAQECEQEECIADAMDISDELSALQTKAEALHVKVKNSPANLHGVEDTGTQTHNVSLLSSVKEQGAKQNILKVFIENEYTGTELYWDRSTNNPYCKSTNYNLHTSLWRILEPEHTGYFDLRKKNNGQFNFFVDATTPYMKQGRPANSQWKFTQVTKRGTLQMMGRSGKLLKTKRDGTLMENPGTTCGKKCSFSVLAFAVRWDSVPQSPFAVTYSNPWAAAALLQQSQNLARTELKRTTSSNGYTVSFTSVGWYGTVNRLNSNQLGSSPGGKYAIDQTKFAMSTQFTIWDADSEDNVMLIQDSQGMYLTCAPGKDAIVGSANPTVYSRWKMWQCLENTGIVGFQCLQKTDGLYFLNSYKNGVAKASKIDCEDSDYKKSYFTFNLRLTGFARRR
jgi:hypothetical protein